MRARGQFAVIRGDRQSELLVDGAGVPLDEGTGFHTLIWSPDGRWLFLMNGVGIMAFDADTGTLRPVDVRFSNGQLFVFARE